MNIHGQGLDTCTAAVLHFPDGEIISGRFLSGGGGGEPSKENATTVNELKARLLHDALHEAEGGAAIVKESSLARRIFNKVMSTKKEQEQASHYFYQGEVETGDVVFEFEVPALKLLELECTTTSTSDSSRGVPKNDSSPTITLPLTLFSDFYKVQTVVQCIPMTAWMIPLESFETLGKCVFSALERAAVDDCINSTSQQQQQQQNRSNQKTDIKISISNSSGEEASASISSVKNEQGAAVAAASVLPAPSSLIDRLNEQGNLVLHFVQRLQDKWKTSTAPPSNFRSVLLRGVLIRDASVAIDSAEPKDLLQRLKIATELLKWKSSTFDTRNKNDDDDDDDEIEFWNDLEVDDEVVSLESAIGLRGRLKRQLKRALQGASLWQKQRWRVLADTPPPDVIVLLASRSTILNTDSNTSEFNLPVVEAVHSLAAAAAACRASVLLAVAAPEAQDVVFRRRLSFSSGLHGRPGAVVPLKVVDSAVDCLLLQSAILTHASAAATAAQQARRDERSLFHARL